MRISDWSSDVCSSDLLPPSICLAYTGLSYEEIQTGGQAPMLYALTVLIVFLCLAALYESWSVPVAVILVVPLGIIGAVSATLLRDLTADVYFQIGLMTTVGLTAKNAILIEIGRASCRERVCPYV